jgi:hypothetical protein
MFIIFFAIKVIFHKQFVLTGQTVNSATTTAWNTLPRTSAAKTGCCITIKQRLTLTFSQGNFFTKNYMTAVPH